LGRFDATSKASSIDDDGSKPFKDYLDHISSRSWILSISAYIFILMLLKILLKITGKNINRRKKGGE
jgi:hypothetical protein